MKGGVDMEKKMRLAKKEWAIILGLVLVVAVVAGAVSAGITGNSIKIIDIRGLGYKVYTQGEIDRMFSNIDSDKVTLSRDCVPVSNHGCISNKSIILDAYHGLNIKQYLNTENELDAIDFELGSNGLGFFRGHRQYFDFGEEEINFIGDYATMNSDGLQVVRSQTQIKSAIYSTNISIFGGGQKVASITPDYILIKGWKCAPKSETDQTWECKH